MPSKETPLVFQQAIEHAPGKCAVAAAALETEINDLGLDLGLWLRSCHFLVHGIALLKTMTPTASCFNTESPLRFPA